MFTVLGKNKHARTALYAMLVTVVLSVFLFATVPSIAANADKITQLLQFLDQ